MHEPSCTALELFGGRDVVLKNMNSLLHKALGSRKVNHLNKIEEQLGLKENYFLRIYSDNRPVGYEEFQLLSGALGISVYDCLGKPSIPSEQRPFWEDRMCKSPILAVPQDSAKSLKIDLESYVYLTAIDELGEPVQSQ